MAEARTETAKRVTADCDNAFSSMIFFKGTLRPAKLLFFTPITPAAWLNSLLHYQEFIDFVLSLTYVTAKNKFSLVLSILGNFCSITYYIVNANKTSWLPCFYICRCYANVVNTIELIQFVHLTFVIQIKCKI